MTTKLLPWIASALGGAAILLFSSCAYNPGYYGPASSYGSSTYYDYPSGNISTSLFISTGNPRWGYDPYCRSYYDYNRHCYYDPWLRGYYPRGYRPPVLVGVPHPHGWHSGRSVCPPPRDFRNHTLRDYQNRGASYRNLGQTWSREVRPAPPGRRSPHHSNNSHQTHGYQQPVASTETLSRSRDYKYWKNNRTRPIADKRSPQMLRQPDHSQRRHDFNAQRTPRQPSATQRHINRFGAATPAPYTSTPKPEKRIRTAPHSSREPSNNNQGQGESKRDRRLR